MNHEITVYFVLFMALLEYRHSSLLEILQQKYFVVPVCKYTGSTTFLLHGKFVVLVFSSMCFKHIILEDVWKKIM